MEFNPYQAPTTAEGMLPSVTTGQIRVEGKQIVVPPVVTLPPFCVKTGEPVAAEDMQTRTLYWGPAYLLLFIFLSLLIGVIIYLFVRKKCDITFGLSRAMRRKYRNQRLLALGLAVLFFFGMIFAAGLDSGGLAVVSMIFFIIALLVAMIGFSPLRAARYKNRQFWIKGCSPEFLARLNQGDSPFR